MRWKLPQPTMRVWLFASGVQLLTSSLTYDDDHRLRRFAELNWWEDGVDQEIMRELDKNCVFVDGGAAFGYYSILARRAGATVHAFNPHPRFAAEMRENLALNNITDGVHIHEAALGAEKGHARLEYGTGAQLGRGVPVRVTTLDELDLRRRAVVKLDIEGHALRGAPRLVAQNTTWFIAAHNNDERRAILSILAGYKVKLLTRTPNEMLMARPPAD